MGVRLQRVSVLGRPAHTPNQRYFFRFPRGRPDHAAAIQVAESLLYGLNISFGPFGDPDTFDRVYALPASMVKGTTPIELGTLIEFEEAKPPQSRTLEFPGLVLGSASFIESHRMAVAWKASRVFFHSHRHREAGRFLKASQDAFYVWPGQIDEVLSEPSLAATTGQEQTCLEDALINAFKVIEALLGDPPRDDRKFFTKLQSIGIDPNESVGYHSSRALHEVIREVGRARDHKSAHGSTPDRIIEVAKMFEYQACARHVLVSALEKQLGEPLFRA